MTTNRTSEAVKDILQWWEERGPRNMMSEKKAIALKYQRMESTLHGIAHGTQSMDLNLIRREAEAAYSFDPLS